MECSGSGDIGSAIVGAFWTILIKAVGWGAAAACCLAAVTAAAAAVASCGHKSRLAALPSDVGVRSPPQPPKCCTTAAGLAVAAEMN